MKPSLPLATTITVSVGFHAVVGVLVVGFGVGDRLEHPPHTRAPSIEVVDPEPEPVAVVLLDDQSFSLPSRTPTAIEPDPIATGRNRAAIAAVVPRSAPAPIEARPLPESKHEPNSMFQMRDPTRDKRGALFTFGDIAKRDPSERAPAGTAPVDDVPETGKLQPSGGGTHRSNEGGFTARVERDGSVSLKNARNLDIKYWPDPRKIPKIPKAIGNHIAAWYAQEDKTPKDPEREPLNNKRFVEKDTRPDHGKASTVPILAGGFDVTDALMRRKKVDPYASKKLAYLDSTRDERVQIGKRYRKGQLAQSGELMQKQLDVVWASTATIAAKKQALFELWEDCAETGDASVVEGGRAARALVIGFINAKFPKGSANAFTTAELAALNGKRKAKSAFEPYR